MKDHMSTIAIALIAGFFDCVNCVKCVCCRNTEDTSLCAQIRGRLEEDDKHIYESIQ